MCSLCILQDEPKPHEKREDFYLVAFFRIQSCVKSLNNFAITDRLSSSLSVDQAWLRRKSPFVAHESWQLTSKLYGPYYN
ncbi:hypothetical protein PanWU01x14_102920 [Parasponia andersonii]|uniref:Uncharacterized protein n=1 Tax=Parasponia andersonii TaxID=3476 RepID=A0A2P5D2G1_PARAD|nr:hypothetical protein PanWU01x14_102920 [Parasponia andersonii]